MAVSPTTTQSLADVAALRQAAGPQIRSALLAAIPAVTNVGVLANQMRGEYQQAEVVEDNDKVQAKLRGTGKTCARIAGRCREIDDLMTRLVQEIKQLQEQDADLRAVVQQES